MSLHFIGFPTNARRRTYQILVLKTFYTYYCTLINLLEQNSVKKDLDEGKEICFDLLQNSQGKIINSRQNKKYSAKKSQMRLKKMSSRQNKEKHGHKTNLANSLGAGYASYFKVVFFV